METIYKHPFDEAQTQWAIDVLLYDKPWLLWEFKWAPNKISKYPWFPVSLIGPNWASDSLYKRIEPKDGNNL